MAEAGKESGRVARKSTAPRATKRTYRVVDLFSGCGGLSHGISKASDRRICFEHVAAVEFDVDAAATYARNIDTRVFCGDIADWIQNADKPSDVDIVLGGPPCQGFSALGKQDVHDARNAMWEHYVAVVAELRPTFFVLENVREFLSSKQAEALRKATASDGLLADYALEEFVLDASLYGSPQRRKRAIVIGRLADLPELGEPPPVAGQKSVRDAFAGLPCDVVERDLPDRKSTFDEFGVRGPFRTDELHLTRNLTKLSLQRFRTIPPEGNRFDIPDRLLSPCWRRHKTGSGDVMGRLYWDRPSVTIRTEFFKPEKGRYLHPEEDRPITHHEAARLQGFPDDFEWFGSKVSIARQIGNAVPIDLAEALGRHIKAALANAEQPGSALRVDVLN
jgi:DNA (cytosine-5)-methyltransferase 1